jgi:hypothetical protein
MSSAALRPGALQAASGNDNSTSPATLRLGGKCHAGSVSHRCNEPAAPRLAHCLLPVSVGSGTHPCIRY